MHVILTFRRVHVNVVAVGKLLNITYSECATVALVYLAYKAHAPYCHLWPVRLYNIFLRYFINGTISKKRKVFNIKISILIFSTNFV